MAINSDRLSQLSSGFRFIRYAWILVVCAWLSALFMIDQWLPVALLLVSQTLFVLGTWRCLLGCTDPTARRWVVASGGAVAVGLAASSISGWLGFLFLGSMLSALLFLVFALCLSSSLGLYHSAERFKLLIVAPGLTVLGLLAGPLLAAVLPWAGAVVYGLFLIGCLPASVWWLVTLLTGLSSLERDLA